MAEVLQQVPSKADQVYDVLRRAILEGVHRPGERLSMDALARDLGVSKIPIREAINRLEVIGFVTTRQHAGPTVAAVDPDQLQGAYLARAELEPLIAALATQQGSDEQILELEEIHESMRVALADEAFARLGDLNFAFHVLLARMSGYRLMEEITETLLLAVRRYRVLEPLDQDNWTDVVAEHDELLRAVSARDEAAAREAARRHATSQAGHDGVVDPAG